MASYGANTTVKVSAAVNQTVGINSSNSAVTYTVPSDSYLDCTFIGNGGTTGSVTIGGVGTLNVNTPIGTVIGQFKLGPGTVVSGTGGTGGTTRFLVLIGTLFENTP